MENPYNAVVTAKIAQEDADISNKNLELPEGSSLYTLFWSFGDIGSHLVQLGK